MDRNSVIGIILIAVILIAYSILSRPSKERLAEQKRIYDSIRIAEEQKKAEQVRTDSTAVISTGKQLEKSLTDSLQIDYGIFSGRLRGKEEFYTVENEFVRITFSTRGGRPYSVELKQYQTYDSLPVVLFRGDSAIFGLEFFSDGRSIRTNDLFFTTETAEKNQVVKDSPVLISFRLPIDTIGSGIEYQYKIYPDKYLIDFDMKMTGMNNYRTDNVQIKWDIYSRQLERGRQNELTLTNLCYRFYEGDFEKLRSRSKKETQEVTETTKIEWVAFKQQFFSSVIIASKIPFEGAYMMTKNIPSGKYILNYNTELSVPYDRSDNFVMNMHLYYGPNHYQSLKRIGFKLENLVTIGSSIIRWINAIVIIPIFNWLNNFISNYGLIILLLTIIIKIGLLPLTYRSYLSTAKMRVLKPQIDEINAKIPKEKAMERQQATMALYKKVGVNPMGGCLPMLLQLPILYAMFRFFPSSIELRQEKFLWADDLSTYDSILNLPFNIPMYGDHVSLFTLLMTITTIFSTKMTPQASGADSSMPGMKTMMYMMPIMFMLILNNISAWLTYYYFLANLISIGQNYLFKLFVDEDKLLKSLNTKKAKSAKKSGFQARLEEMAKKRGYKLPK